MATPFSLVLLNTFRKTANKRPFRISLFEAKPYQPSYLTSSGRGLRFWEPLCRLDNPEGKGDRFPHHPGPRTSRAAMGSKAAIQQVPRPSSVAARDQVVHGNGGVHFPIALAVFPRPGLFRG